jgi:hypothetical protein
MKVQVCNPAEYEGRVLIEADYHPEYGFAVPAWEERGLSELCGPFATEAEARATLAANAEYLVWLGYSPVN